MAKAHKVHGISWWALAQTAGPIVLLCIVAVALAMLFVHGPPRTLTIAGGLKGTAFDAAARAYSRILKRDEDITLKVVPSQGSAENLKRLEDPRSGVDIALVQAGINPVIDTADLVSLGSMFYQPLLIFYRSAKPIVRLSQLRGERIAIGSPGSGTRYVALQLLYANGIDGNDAQLLPLDGEDARKALLDNRADAIFLTSDSAPRTTIRDMLHMEGIRLYDFPRADAYLRRFPYLSKLVVPAGTFDLGADLPPADLTLLAPTVELIAHRSLNPALSDVLIGAAFEVHGHATLLQAAGTFPKALAHDFPLSPEAARYYKSGNRSLLYRFLPFWVASLVNRLMVALVPLVVVLIPGLNYLPQLYRWRVNSRIHHRYGELMALEREAVAGELSEAQRVKLTMRLREIEKAIIDDRIPGSHATQLYLLRHHLRFVREHLTPQAIGGLSTAEPILPLNPSAASL